MSTEGKEIVRFDGMEISIQDANGDRWVTCRELGEALGYSDPTDVTQVIDRNPVEFQGKQGVLKMNTPGGPQEMRVLNYRGALFAALCATI